jgi:Protein of unknown function (DUF3105)
VAKKNRKQRQAARAAAGTTTPRQDTVRDQPTRAERSEAQRRARRHRALRNRVIVGGVVVLAAGGLVFNWASDWRQSQRLIASLEAGSCDFDRDTDPGRDHVASPTFRVDPPSGGDHLAAPASAGTYQVGNMPADGNLVHSLEHGFVILWHRPVLADAQLDQLLAVAGPYERDVLVVPRASLSTRVAATAWHKRLQCPSLEPMSCRASSKRSATTGQRTYRTDGPTARSAGEPKGGAGEGPRVVNTGALPATGSVY